MTEVDFVRSVLYGHGEETGMIIVIKRKVVGDDLVC